MDFNRHNTGIAQATFETTRYLYSDRQEEESAKEHHLVIANPDHSSPVRALMLSIYGTAPGRYDAGMCIRAIGKSDVLPTHLRDKALFIEDNPFRFERWEMLHEGGLDYPEAPRLSRRSDVRAKLCDALNDLTVRDLTVDTMRYFYAVHVIDLETLDKKVRETCCGIDHSPVEHLGITAYSDTKEVAQKQLKSLFDDIERSGAFSEDPTLNRDLCTKLKTFIDQHYLPKDLCLARKNGLSLVEGSLPSCG